MTPAFRWSVLGVLVAIAITTAMDAGGLSAFSSLPLLPLMALFWYLGRFSRTEVGFAWGRWRHHGLAVLYPLVVLGSAALIAAAAGAVHLANADWKKAGLNLVLVTVSTILARDRHGGRLLQRVALGLPEKSWSERGPNPRLEQHRVFAVALVGDHAEDGV